MNNCGLGKDHVIERVEMKNERSLIFNFSHLYLIGDFRDVIKQKRRGRNKRVEASNKTPSQQDLSSCTI